MAIDANTQIPGLLCDVLVGPLYRDEAMTIVAVASWPGQVGVGLYATAANPAVQAIPVRISLSPGEWEVLYAPLTTAGNVRAAPPFAGGPTPIPLAAGVYKVG